MISLFLVLLLTFLFHRKEKELHNKNWEYSTRNPDYVDTVSKRAASRALCEIFFQAEVYEVDDWEVERDDLIMNQELGKGSFGMVYKGVYKDPKKVILKFYR